jgi:hypothetical protein
MTETPSIRNGLQRCENLRNSLGLNYKSAALDQLSYAGERRLKGASNPAGIGRLRDCSSGGTKGD